MAQADKKADDTIGLYPIREVAEKTGVNPITLRAWERRYGLVTPQRTPKGHRLYSEKDIELIRKVLATLETGIPISRVREVLEQPHGKSMPSREADEERDWEIHTEQLVKAAMTLNSGALDTAYHKACQLYPSGLLVRRILRPALEQMERLTASEPQYAHGATFLRHYLLHQIGQHIWQQTLRNRGVKILLGGLPGDDSELNACFLALHLVERDYRLIWVPDTTPLLYLPLSTEISAASALILYIDRTPPQRVIERELPLLRRQMSIPVMVAGEAVAHQVSSFETTGLIPLPLDTELLLTQLSLRVAEKAPEKVE